MYASAKLLATGATGSCCVELDAIRALNTIRHVYCWDSWSYAALNARCRRQERCYSVLNDANASSNAITGMLLQRRHGHSAVPYRRNSAHGVKRSFSSAATSRLTWKDHVQEARSALRTCDFVAVDVEYTGLHLKDDRFVGLEKCYEAHASGAKQFVPCQIGLTAAKYLGKGVWKITPTSVYTIPSSNKFFQVSTSTLQFLKDNNFDFNSWIRHGVEHLTPAEERDRKASIELRIKELDQLVNSAPPGTPAAAVEFDLSSLTAEDRSVAEDVIGRIKDWIRSGDNNPLEIELDSAFQRLLMHTIIGQQFPEVYSHSARRGDEKVICIYKSQVELYKQQKLTLQAELARIDEEIGVRALFDEISQHGKILVGHNCFYDMLHIYQTFYGELPESVEEFRKLWTDKFRNTLDTKYIAEFHDAVASTQQSSTLKGLFDHMCATEPTAPGGTTISVHPLPGTSWVLPPAVLPLLAKTGTPAEISADSFKTADGSATVMQSHDAGYDSFMTCVLFVLQSGRILRSKHANWDKLCASSPDGSLNALALLEHIGPSTNCIRLVKSQPNAINLATNREGNMDRYFLMTGYPNSWKKWDIMKVWSPLWVSVSVIDDTSCWVIVKNDEDIRNINLIYRMMKNPQFRLETYEQSRSRKPGTDATLTPVASDDRKCI
ncbi:CAF1 family ribonuclease containing protein, putative [Babesia bigemina]|uniref:Poly(A)-specific ribonuclease PARN n=1 Tax=Babesia bigemina TaxID=5866 RepID=A0A061D4W6_BABBI|nr:CAF1 family ribonuclease containing protein, putative [Babesia bigemina]CDR93999.1 CAF1 family ribonuclease containing protein, putative [Babesia bigemina]|eukprot:XP_012766185.1 CAF1 family ribonuclease containing protein, putative [Babesia bigemina]